MNTRRNFLNALGVMLLCASPSSFARQQPTKIARIGLLSAGSATKYPKRVDALRASLRDLGYEEGRNLTIELRWAEGKYDQLPQLAAGLIGLKVDVLVTIGTPATVAAKRATTTIPIVMVSTGDAVGTSLVSSLARPGGNVTGSTVLSPQLMAKRLELLRQAVPRTRQVGVLLNPHNRAQVLSFQAMQITASKLDVGLQKFEVQGTNEFESVFSAMAKQHVDAVAILQDTLFLENEGAIARLASKQLLPSIGPVDFADAGGLMGYGVYSSEPYRRAATYVDRILKGAKPADLPVERPTKFELVVNMKTAKALGIKFPDAILVLADKVIEA